MPSKYPLLALRAGKRVTTSLRMLREILFSQSLSVVMQNQTSCKISFSILNWKLLYEFDCDCDFILIEAERRTLVPCDPPAKCFKKYFANDMIPKDLRLTILSQLAAFVKQLKMGVMTSLRLPLITKPESPYFPRTPWTLLKRER